MTSARVLGFTTRARFNHRRHTDADGSILFLLARGGAVRLTQREWARVERRHIDAMAVIDRRLSISFLFSIPIALLTMALIPRTLTQSIDDFGPAASLAAGLLTLCWWPLLHMWLHYRSVRHIDGDLDALLTQFPAAPVPKGRPRLFQGIEIVAMVLAGPGIAIELVGSTRPHLLDGTPLMGHQIGVFSAIGLAAFLVVLVRKGWRRDGD